MSYNPKQGRDIRSRFDSDRGLYVIQQERTRTANGATNPNDLGGILDLGATGWEERYACDNVQEMLEELFNITFSEDCVVREIDIGDLDPLSATVQAALTRMQLLTI